MNSITLNAEAKINLYLDVTGKKDNGYHLLETVMHSVSLCDIVKIEKASQGIEILCSDNTVPCDERNIAYKCAEAFFHHTDINDSGVRITIEKNIPSQAGLGGGSSDGAAVLRGMNEIFEAKLTYDELCFISSSIGADIPFCIKGGCGLCTGIGEIISPIPPLCGYVLIGKGKLGISTKNAFEKIDSTNFRIGIKNIHELFLSASHPADIAHLCKNIFEEVTELDEVAQIKQIMLKNGAMCACMTGSGSAVFGLYNSPDEAQKAHTLIKAAGFFSELCTLTKGNMI